MQVRASSSSFARLGLFVLALGALAGSAQADVRYLYSTIDGNQEVPPVPTAATGEGIYILNDLLALLQFEITYQNLTSGETQSHFHGPAAPGANGGILHHMPLGTPKVATWFLSAAEVAHLQAGLVYANVHTSSFPAGEIRGQLVDIGRGFCFGDGTGTPCPCANSAGVHEGCRNTTGAGGRLRPAGNLGAGPASLRMIADQLIPGQPVLLFRGNNAIAGGAGAVFGDGLRCVGAGIVRLGVRIPDGTGRAQWLLGSVPVPPLGTFLRYQGWYRDPAGGGVCGSGFNLTNAVELP